MTESLAADLPLIERARALEARGVFLGGPIRKFESVGRNQLSILLRSGLDVGSKVLDVGCGCLRGGYWLIHLLRPGCYHGIEANADMLEAGKEWIVTPEVLEAKRPRFDNNREFDFGVFGERFDFYLARSVWTHASPKQIETMLDQFLATRNEGARFLTSFKPCPWYKRQYSGEEWIGKSDRSGESGLVYYHFSWIQRICAARGLSVEKLDKEFGQVWLRIH